MKMLVLLKFSICYGFFYALACVGADFSTNNSCGPGYTNNAGLTKDDKKIDVFFKINSNNIFQRINTRYNLNLTYKKYYDYENNDNIFGKMSISKKFQLKIRTSITGMFFFLGQEFIRDPEYIDDESFDNYGGGSSLHFLLSPYKTVEPYFEIYFSFKNYPDFSNRLDRKINLSGGLDKEVSKATTLNAESLISILNSSEKYYSYNSIGLTGGIYYYLNLLSLYGGPGLTYKYYPNRTIQARSPVYKNKANPVDKNEQDIIYFMRLRVEYKVLKSLKIVLDSLWENKISNNSAAGYQVFEVSGKLTLTF